MRFLTQSAVVSCLLIAALASAQTVKSINLEANHILYEPVSGKIYATLPSSVGSHGNSVATVDPATGHILRYVFIGSEPDVLAASDDGKFLYVGLHGADAIRRYSIVTHSAGPQFSLGSDPNFGPYYAGDIKVLPGQPHAVAVARNLSGISPSNNGVAIYDDGVQRTNVVTRQQGLMDSLAFSASAAVLYAQDTEDSADTLNTLAVDSNGVTLSQRVNDLWGEFGGPILFDANTAHIFDTTGRAADPQASALTGTFSETRQVYNYYGSPTGGIAGIVPDTANGRVFFLIDDELEQSSSVTLAAFDSNTYMPLGTLVLPNVVTPENFNSYAADLIPWGTDGLAFRTTDGRIWLISGRSLPGLASFDLSATKVLGGTTVNGTVTLTQAAPGVGVTITLSSSNPGTATPPTSVSIASGQTSASFSITTSGGDQDVTLTAAYGVQSIARSLEVDATATDSVYPANMRILHLTTNDLVFDPVSKRIYASVPSNEIGIGNSIIPISPASASPGTAVFIGSEPYRLAISSDGEVLYAGLNGAASIRCFDPPTQTADLQYSLGHDSFLGPYFPGKLVVLPGKSHSLAVSRYYPWVSPSFAGIPIYDDDVERPNVYTGFTGGETITAGASAGRLYGYDDETTNFEFDRFKIDSNGISLLDSTGNLISGFGVDIAYQGGMIFATNGKVIDAEARTPVGTFSGIGATAIVLPDLADKKVFFVDADISGGAILRLFDPTTFLEIADFSLPGTVGYPSSLLRWKADNLAFRTDSGQVFFVNATLPELSKLTITPSKIVGGNKATGKIQLSNVATIGGIAVKLVSSNPHVVSVPGSMTVQAGTQSVVFPVQTSSVSTSTQVTITAKYNSLSKSVTLTINP